MFNGNFRQSYLKQEFMGNDKDRTLMGCYTTIQNKCSFGN